MPYARHPSVLWRSTSRGPVVLAPASARPDRLGGIAAAVWEVLDTPMTATEVAIAVQAVLEQAIDVDAALVELVATGLVVDP